MSNEFYRGVLCVGLILLLGGCGHPGETDLGGDSSNPSCDVLFVPHIGEAEVDRHIRRFQAASADGSHGPYLERLGWSFVSKARDSDDAGYLAMAQRVAECLDALAGGWSDSAALLLGHVLHQQHQFEEAEETIRRLVDRRGHWYDHAVLGDVLLDLGRLMESSRHYQIAMDSKPGPQTFIRAANLRWLTGDAEGAIDMMQRAIRAGDVRDPSASAWSYTTLARWVWQQQGVGEAVRLIDAASAMSPSNRGVLALRGRIALASGDSETAVADLEKATEGGGHPEWLWWLLEALEPIGPKAAVAVEEEFDRLAELEDRRTLSVYLATHGIDPERALRLAKEEVGIRRDALSKDALSWAYWANGDFARARDWSLDALAMGSIEPRLHFHAAVIAAAVGDPTAAQKHFHDAQSLADLLLPSERHLLRREFAAFAADPSVASLVTDGSLKTHRRKF